MKLLAIDPGTKQSGWVMYDTVHGSVVECGVWENGALLRMVGWGVADELVFEMIASQGMAVGAETFETCVWLGAFCARFCEASGRAWAGMSDERTPWLTRSRIKGIICGSQKANDSNIRRALLDMWGGDAAGRKGGPLAEVKTHAWQALAVAVAYEKLVQYRKVKHED